MNKTQIIMYDYVKPKFDENALCTYNQMIFTKILQKMLKLDLILQIMN